MRKLLSLPPNAVKDYNRLHNRNRNEFFCTSDPRGKRLGSGSGTTWLLEECYRKDNTECDFNEWLSQEKRILVPGLQRSKRGKSCSIQHEWRICIRKQKLYLCLKYLNTQSPKVGIKNITTFAH
jgi:hypothetical protein